MTTLTYKLGLEFLLELLKLKASEVRVLCPKCGSELLYAPDYETAAKLNINTGLWCPKDHRHVSVAFNLKH
jgi:hypothetical protein